MRAAPVLLILALGVAAVIPAAQAQTQLTLAPQGVPAVGKFLSLVATLRDSNGVPIAGAKVSLFEQATFGRLDLGNYTSDAAGHAYGGFTPQGSGVFVLGASFPGDGLHEAAQVSIHVTIATPPTPGVDLSFVAILSIIVAVVAGVWATYAFVVLQVLLIRREGRRIQAPGHRLEFQGAADGGGGEGNVSEPRGEDNG